MFRPRQPVLNQDLESILKTQLLPLWEKGLSAIEIAKRLGFGKLGPYEKLKDYHVFYYRRKFGLRPRVKRKSGIPRYKHRPEDIDPPSLDELISILDRVYPLNHPFKSIVRQSKLARAYILIHYYTPLRKSEVYERSLKEFKIGKSRDLGKYLIIDLYRKKKIVDQKHPAKKMPVLLDLESPHANEILDWMTERLQEAEDNKQLVFPISSWQAWNIIKKAFPEMYPHYWRFKYITDRASNPMIPIEDLLADTDLHILTLRKYLMTGERQIQLSYIRRKERRIQEEKELKLHPS